MKRAIPQHAWQPGMSVVWVEGQPPRRVVGYVDRIVTTPRGEVRELWVRRAGEIEAFEIPPSRVGLMP